MSGLKSDGQPETTRASRNPTGEPRGYHTSAIPVIVCTTAAQAVSEQEGHLAAQGVRVLYKPFDVDEMLTMINQAIATNKDTIKNKEP